jgi:hypothetical protein
MKRTFVLVLAIIATALPATEAQAGTHWVTTWGASTQPD